LRKGWAAMADVITESGMGFITDNAFYIERSRLYKSLGDGVRSVEFVRCIDDMLLFVEAKTTFPNPDNPSEENLARFQTEIEDICDKFIHSLNLFSSIKIGIAEDSFSGDLVLPEKASLKFVLVIKNHEIKWCKNIKKALYDAMPLYLKMIWKPDIFVINHKGAISYNLAKS